MSNYYDKDLDSATRSGAKCVAIGGGAEATLIEHADNVHINGLHISKGEARFLIDTLTTLYEEEYLDEEADEVRTVECIIESLNEFLEKRMTVDEYVDKRIKELEMFRAMWHHQSSQSGADSLPNYWPKNMPHLEWYEQEDTWNEMTYDNQMDLMEQK